MKNKDLPGKRPQIQNIKSRKIFLVTVIIIISICSGCSTLQPGEENASSGLPQYSHKAFTDFETRLDTVRQALKIPGMSAAVVRDQELVWAAGFGSADLENQVAARPDTPYSLASVTKPIAAVLVMQLVELGIIDLDAPVSQYGVDAGDERVTVRHLLTHTSEGEPGTTFFYNGDRYALLGAVIEAATGKSFAELLSEKILLPLEMKSTALNPISQSGSISSKPIEDLKLMAGYGASFQHYPDVYQRLAKPYQLDAKYNIIPGMYHLHHQPAAGLNSSAVDLAKFDIALDQGILLGDAIKAEMFSPAYSTYQDRQDLMYGLGWYAQEFEGLRLNWHTGRWPPSTSGLYLKVPELNLTFIVLANTDNLTVPFNGLGKGDVSQSAMAQSFFHYFVYPQLLGIPLPEIDWSRPEQALIQQLSAVEDLKAQSFLERELWSFRQVYASVGRYDQVDTLLRVNKRFYPYSEFRNDELFTSLARNYPVIPPVLPASAFTWLGRVVIAWFLMVFISIAILIVQMKRADNLSLVGKTIWLAATLFMGPITVLIRAITLRRRDGEKAGKWQLALTASVLTITGYTIAWIPAITLLISFGTNPHPFAILGTTYLLPFMVGLCLIRVPLQASHMEIGLSSRIKSSLLAELITFNLGFGILFSVTWLFSNRLLTTIPLPASPFFWLMLSLIAIVGMVSLFPLHYWMIKRGYSVPSTHIPEGTQNLAQPTLPAAWPALLATLAIMVVALGITISQVA